LQTSFDSLLKAFFLSTYYNAGATKQQMNLVEFTMSEQSSFILVMRVATAFDIQNRENILSF